MRARTSLCKIGRVVLRVLIVDDNKSFLDAASVLLERERLRVVGVALTVADALRRAEELRPHVALVDITLDGESGLDVAQRLFERDPVGGPAVILVSTHAEEDVADLIADSPAAGFLSKSELSADAIRRILNDRAQ
jgi:two-component system nitrate/nitrite response regulator NarL